jgi:EAL domain-containing protein (putative c-di-GMP-specific phosphodiesterase class I)
MKTFEPESITVKEKLALIKVITDYALECSDENWITGDFYNCRLSSAFQPIFSSTKGKILGHAAYIRSDSNGELALSPWQVFSLASKDTQLVELDHLCRAVHALNYFYKAAKQDKLFIDIHPRLLESIKDDHGRMFGNFLSLIGISTSRIVIEIPSIVNRDWKLLKQVIINYRSRGYQIMANYSGSSSDWMAELGNLYPDIVNIHACDLLRHKSVDLLKESIHRFGSTTLLVRNIKTSEHLAAALHAGADYLQGNYLGKVERAINTTLPPQLSEKFNAERWRRQISSIYQQYEEQYPQYAEKSK